MARKSIKSNESITETTTEILPEIVSEAIPEVINTDIPETISDSQIEENQESNVEVIIPTVIDNMIEGLIEENKLLQQKIQDNLLKLKELGHNSIDTSTSKKSQMLEIYKSTSSRKEFIEQVTTSGLAGKAYAATAYQSFKK